MSTELRTKEENEFIEETSVFIDNTNRESMEMIKKAILLAINRLQQYQPVGEDEDEDEDKDAYYLKEKDVLAAIELSYDIQVAEYEALQKIAIAGITGIPIEDNKQTINGLHKITDEELARATAMFLPASPNTSPTTSPIATPTATPNANNILSEPADPNNSLIIVPHNPNGTITIPGTLPRATAMFLPASPTASPTGTPTGTPKANNNLELADPKNSLITVPHNPNGTITLPRGGMYRPKKSKKSRKHPK
jgi:hypothetical protein